MLPASKKTSNLPHALILQTAVETANTAVTKRSKTEKELIAKKPFLIIAAAVTKALEMILGYALS